MDLFTLTALLGDGLAVGSIYALTALGLTLVYGLLRVLHVAHAGVYAVGAYAGWWAFQKTGSFGLALGTGAVAAALLGLFLETWFYRPLLSRPPHVALIGSIGLFLAVGDLLRILFGPYQQSLPALAPVPVVGMLTVPQLVVVGATAVLLLGVYFLVEQTRLGLGWRAMAQDAPTAAALGVDLPLMSRLAFLAASLLAGLAGVLVGAYYNQVYPTMGAVLAYKGLAIVVLGGLGNLWGTVAAALLLGLLESLAVAYLGHRFPPEGVAFVALILVLLFRPQGLFSRAPR
ncbi:branched-chain amino acid ABC transporter permease [Thermus thermophilus]|uniref:branched-chain amino acid ABC transporter permease n=1 Tax=Thermus thermophilus TaxID=274 RepID=UPI001FCB6EE1|nr:branched-chain amino acid ABC transporter permease [Thermus thermophilus]BDG30022.1 branched-chain amino acid ABC transporter permease [Thermus thermophilus]